MKITRSTHLLKKVSLMVGLCLAVLSSFGQNSNYTISSLDGTSICLKRSDSTYLLKVKINAPTAACKITQYKIIWDDGVEDVIKFDPNNTEHSHRYDFRNFVSNCNVSVRRNVEIETDNKSCQSNITPVYFYNEPKPDFVVRNNSCVGQLIGFSGQMCPNSPTTKMFWEYGDNTSDSSGVHAYAKAGVYKVKLTVQNDCGTASVTKSITIIEEPKAVIADSGFVSSNNTVSNYCLKNGSVIVRLDATKSISAAQYAWIITNPIGGSYQYIEKTNSNSPRPKLVFTAKGQYTVSLSVTSICGLIDKVTKTINVDDLPNVTITPQVDACQTINYKIDNFVDGASYVINTEPSPTNLAKGQVLSLNLRDTPYIVKATFSNICGNVSLADTFYVTTPKNVKITSFRDTTVCLNTSALALQTDVAIGTWSSSPSASITGNKFNPNRVGTFTLTFTNGSGNCARSDNVTARVVTLPNLTLTPQPDVCQAISYKVANYIDGAVYTVNTDPTATTLIKDQSVTLGVRENVYIVKASFSNVCGNISKADTFFVASPKAVKITSFRDTTVCLATQPLLLKAAQTGGAWSGNLVTGSSFSPNNLGRFSILYSTGQGACNIADTAYVSVKGTVISLTDKTVCGYDSIIKLQPSPSTGKWTINNCTTCKTVGDSLFISKATTNKVLLTYQVVNDGCTNTKDMAVNIAPTPKVDFTVSGQCIGVPLITGNNSTNVAAYQWFIDNTFVSSNQTINPSNLSVGIHTFLLKGANGSCRDSSTKTLELLAPPQSININSTANEGCSPLNVSFTATGSQEKSVTYTWDFANGQLTKDFAPTQQQFTTVPSQVKIYKVSLTSTNACGTKKVEKDITVKTIPLADVGVDSTTLRCSPARILFSNRSIGGEGQAKWEWGDGGSPTMAKTDTISHLYSAKDTIQTYRVRLTSDNICGTSRDSIDIKVYPSSVVALFQMSKSIVCPNEPITFIDATRPIPQKLVWKFGDGSSPSQANNPIHAFTTPNRSFTVTLTSYTQCGYDSVQKNIQVKAAPTGDFTFPSLNCAEQKVQFTNKSNINLYNSSWNFGDGSAVDSVNFSPAHLYATAGNKSVTLTLKDFITGCTTPITKNLTIRDKVKAQFHVVGDSVLCSPAMVQLVNTSINANMFEWTFSDGQQSTLASPTLSFGTGRYTTMLTASFNGQCRDSIEVVNSFVIDSCFALFPEVFTPNNDGIGDQYTLFGTGIKKINSLKIRNRWNELIFEKTDFVPNNSSMGWDGLYKDQPAPSGLYVYEVEVEFTGQKPKKMPPGHFYLVRKD